MFELSPVDVLPFSTGFLSNLARITPKCGETCPIPGQRKLRNIMSHLWLSWCFGYDKNPPKLPSSPCMSLSSQEVGWCFVLSTAHSES